MKKPVRSIERNEHMNHLSRIVPLIGTIFMVQCYMLYKITNGQNMGDFAMFLGFSLISIIGILFLYDTKHKVDFYENDLHIHFAPLGIDKRINYNEITSVDAVNDQAVFSTITLTTTDGLRHHLHLIDKPQEIKSFLQRQIGVEEEFDQVA